MWFNELCSGTLFSLGTLGTGPAFVCTKLRIVMLLLPLWVSFSPASNPSGAVQSCLVGLLVTKSVAVKD